MRVVEESRDGETELLIFPEMWGEVREQDALLDVRHARLQAEGVAQAKEIGPAYAERQARTETGRTGRRVERGSTANASELGPAADCEGIAARLIQLIQHVARVLIAARILGGDLHFGEDAEFV